MFPKYMERLALSLSVLAGLLLMIGGTLYGYRELTMILDTTPPMKKKVTQLLEANDPKPTQKELERLLLDTSELADRKTASHQQTVDIFSRIALVLIGLGILQAALCYSLFLDSRTRTKREQAIDNQTET
ncbi:MAG: hypothetical protein WD002_10270 [Pseudomonadales bacterium]